MKIFLTLLLSFGLIQTFGIAQDSLDTPRKADQAAPELVEELGEEDFDDDDFGGADFEDWEDAIDEVTPAEIKAIVKAEFLEQAKWLSKQDRELQKEMGDWLEEVVREAAAMKKLSPDEYDEHIAWNRADMELERWMVELNKGDLSDEDIATGLRKALTVVRKRDMKDLEEELEWLNEDLADIKEEIREIEKELEEMENKGIDEEIEELLEGR